MALSSIIFDGTCLLPCGHSIGGHLMLWMAERGPVWAVPLDTTWKRLESIKKSQAAGWIWGKIDLHSTSHLISKSWMS